ncbi:hypothetical protein TWF718_002334 [Orbilia javanica]|uniref:Serine protease n=1 Tax=Orbilia javanica TaxID=47235 RepID=A0AAN8MMA8_9PEZI
MATRNTPNRAEICQAANSRNHPRDTTIVANRGERSTVPPPKPKDVQVSPLDILSTPGLGPVKLQRMARDLQILSGIIHANIILDRVDDRVQEIKTSLYESYKALLGLQTLLARHTKGTRLGWTINLVWILRQDLQPPYLPLIDLAVRSCAVNNKWDPYGGAIWFRLSRQFLESEHSYSNYTASLKTALQRLDKAISSAMNLDLGIVKEGGPIRKAAWILSTNRRNWREASANESKSEAQKEIETEECFFPQNQMAEVNHNDREGRFKGIVKLKLIWKTNRGVKFGFGTGALIKDKKTVITSAHLVLTPGWHLYAVEVIVGLGTEHERNILGTHVVCHMNYFKEPDPVFDIAMIRMGERAGIDAPFRWAVIPSDGPLQVSIIGYPSFSSENARRANRSNSRMQRSNWSAPAVREATKYSLLEHKASTYHGSSGSPVFLSTNRGLGDGTIIAIHSRGRGSAEDGSNRAALFSEKSRSPDGMYQALVAFEDKNMNRRIHMSMDHVYCLDEVLDHNDRPLPPSLTFSLVHSPRSPLR